MSKSAPDNSPAERGYFGCQVNVWHCGQSWPPYPWRFSVTRPNGHRSTFAGIPNYCGSRAGALRRGWWRARWISDGSFDRRYVPA